jgi:transcriptional regulator with XRE-family HTH domain
MQNKRLFGLAIRAVRKEHGLTQERFAEVLDRSVDAISKMERGITSPGHDTLVRLSAQFSIPLDIISSWLNDAIDPPDQERVILEARLAALAKRLELPILRIAVEQITVLATLSPLTARRRAP